MDQIKTGELIRKLRQEKGMTQNMLAEMLVVTDKAVSKWERGGGMPDLSLLPQVAEILGVNMDNLLKGEMEENEMINGNMKKIVFYVCPDCGNIVFSAVETGGSCCGKKLSPLLPKKADDEHKLSVETIENELYVHSEHEMTRENCISFVALLGDDTVILRKFYPEWTMQTRFPRGTANRLVWYSEKDGLLYQ